MKKPTEAQRVYLEMAARDDGLDPDAISPGSSYRCVLRLVESGWLDEQHVSGIGPRWFTSSLGLQALGCQM